MKRLLALVNRFFKAKGILSTNNGTEKPEFSNDAIENLDMACGV